MKIKWFSIIVFSLGRTGTV